MKLKLASAILAVLIAIVGCVPVNTYAASKAVTVTTQKELETALKNAGKSTIVIEDGKTEKYTVSKGNYSKSTLVIKADDISVDVKKGAKIGTLVLTGDDINVSNAGKISKIKTDADYQIPSDDADKDEPQKPYKKTSKVGYITKERTKVESKYIIFDIDPNVYVVPNLTEIADKIFETMEKVTGLTVKNGKYYDGKIVCHVNREGANDDPYETQGWAMGTEDEFWITPIDLFVESGYAFTHELGHSFNRDFVSGFAGTVADEGFTTYTELKICEYLEKNDPDLAAILGSRETVKANMWISDYDAMYDRSVEYWMDHRDEAEKFCSNNLYGIGFRLMGFLEEKYGSYIKWFDEFDKIASAEAEKKDIYSIDGLPREEVHKLFSKALKTTYEKSVFDEFYKWMKKNEGGRLDEDPEVYTNSFSNVSEYTIYPKYYHYSNATTIGRFDLTEYKDLIVNIAPAEYYLREYKGEDTSALVLNVSSGVTVETYDKDGKMTGRHEETVIPLKNVDHVKLVGKGTTKFAITGYNIYGSY